MRILIVLAIGMYILPVSAHASLLYLEPAQGTFGPGDTFIVNVRLEPSECVNAARVEISYPSESLRAVDFSKGGSIFTLFAEEPLLDVERGLVTFSGGIPGGYCGRVSGDPVLSNILGKVVFTVVGGQSDAAIHISDASRVYANDGLGSETALTTQDALITLAPQALQASNPWVDTVEADSIPPEEFTVDIQSTRGVFDGNYYIVFSTLDKQSGLDHYEIFERGIWQTVTSPHALRDQSLSENIQVKAIDKAGNERIGAYDSTRAPGRQSRQNFVFFYITLAVFVIGGAFELYRLRRRAMTPLV